MKKLYVGNLSYEVSENDLSDLFAEFGEVNSVKMIMDRETGSSKGFGFVEMADGAAADQIIDELNDTEYQGRKLRINEAREKSDNDRRGGGGGYRGESNGNRF